MVRKATKELKPVTFKKEADFGFSFFKKFWREIFAVAGEFKLTLSSIFKFLLVSKVGLVLALVTLVIPLMAFEAHVVNVTATIERRQNECPALSIGYWRNHEGCTRGGGGSSIWETQVQALSATFSGAFSGTTGSEMCGNLWIPNCPSGSSVPAKLCRARAQTLADELNVVSGRLDLNAIIAGADDGSTAFDNLGLNSNSTISQALGALEAVLVNPSSTAGQLTEAAHVAERIYAFYEDENPQAPMCLYSWDGVQTSAFSASILIEEVPQFGSDGGSGDEPEATSEEPSDSSLETPAVPEEEISGQPEGDSGEGSVLEPEPPSQVQEPPAEPESQPEPEPEPEPSSQEITSPPTEEPAPQP